MSRGPRTTSHGEALLAQIGLVDRNHDGIVEDASGRRRPADAAHRKRADRARTRRQGLSDQLRTIGLTVDVVALEGNALVQTFVSGQKYDAVYFHLTSTSADPALNRDFWLSSGDAHIWNPHQKSASTEWERQIDELMGRNISALDETIRAASFVEAQKIFAAHQPMVYFAAPRVMVAHRRA